MSVEKSTRWAFTAYEKDYALIDSLVSGHDLIAEIGFQDEVCPTSGRKHRQGYLRTVRQVRFGQLKEVLGTIHFEVAKSWNALVAYCRKVKSRDPSGSQVQVKFERPMRLHEMLIEVASTLLSMDSTVGIDRQTDRQVLLRWLREGSQNLVHCNPEYAIVLVRADAKDAWCDYVDVWFSKAAMKDLGPVVLQDPSPEGTPGVGVSEDGFISIEPL